MSSKSKLTVYEYIPEFVIGGIAKFFENLYPYMDHDKIQLIVIRYPEMGEGSFIVNKLRDAGCIFCDVPSPLKPIRHLLAVGRLFKSEAVSGGRAIVHSHNDLSPLLFFAAKKKYGINAKLYHVHKTKRGSSIYWKISNLLSIAMANKLLACSKAAGEAIFGNHSFTIINNGIAVDKYLFSEEKRCKLRKELKLEGKFVLGHVGRLAHAKNHDFLLDIFHVVYEKNPNAVLLLVGDGELKQKLQQKARTLRIEDAVIFAGARSDVPDLLSAMDVFVFPSYREGLGIVAIESQASGLKTICADTIPIEAKITDLFEYMFLNQSAEEWASCILKYKDGYERKDMSQEVRDAGYDIRQSAKQLEQIYLELAGEEHA